MRNKECYPEPCENPHVVDTTGMDLDKENSGLTPKQKRIMGAATALLFMKGNVFALAGCNSENEAELNDRQPTEIENVEEEWVPDSYEEYLWTTEGSNEIIFGEINRERLNERELELLDMPVDEFLDLPIEDRAAFVHMFMRLHERRYDFMNRFIDEPDRPLDQVPGIDTKDFPPVWARSDWTNNLEEANAEDLSSHLSTIGSGMTIYTNNMPIDSDTRFNFDLAQKIFVTVSHRDPSSDLAQQSRGNMFSRFEDAINSRMRVTASPANFTIIDDQGYDPETSTRTFTRESDQGGRGTLTAFTVQFDCLSTGEPQEIILFDQTEPLFRAAQQ